MFTWENENEFHTWMTFWFRIAFTWWLGHFKGTLHVDKNTRVIQNRKHYACASRSSLPADQFHTEKCGRFAFTWYRCEISNRSEILAPVQQPGWLALAWHFVVVSCNKCRAMRGNRSELAPARKSPLCHSLSLVSNCTRQLFLTMSKPPGSFWNFIIEQNWLITVK